jgi:hypothetical protein
MAAPSPFDGDRSAGDELPADTLEFATGADPGTSRYQGEASGYDLYLVKGTGSVQVCLVYTNRTGEHSGSTCGGGDWLKATLPGEVEFLVKTGGFTDEPGPTEAEVSRWVRQTAGASR